MERVSMEIGKFFHSNYVMGTENMEILKVVIADDEVRICQLIQALIDWDSLGMKVVGIAHNGEDACEMVQQTQPDILITDIRMPGCSGLELVKRVKELDSALEVIIISGYARFEYAQQAISYGVGHYLLKPVNKGELTATLQKLQKKIGERKESELNHQELVNKAKRDDDHLRANLIDRLLDQPDMPVSQDTLTSIYHLKARQGVYQAFCVKVDYGRKIISGGRMDGTTGMAGEREISSTSSEVLMEKVREALERNLKNDSRELILLIRDDYCYGILNYPESEKESIRRSMKSSLTQMEIQKNMFQHVSFSMAVGAAYKEAERLADSMQEARKLIQERLVKGDGRVLDCMGKASEIQESELLKKYLREITHAVEISSIQNAAEAVEDLQDTVNKAKEIRGSEIFELVYAAADIFAASIRIPERTATVEEFRKQCDKCGKIEEIFSCLGDFQQKYIQEQAERYENDTIRPVRKAKEYIQNHFSDPLTLEEVSEMVGLSTAYFSALFKKTEGEGFAKYLINVRMEQAKLLLRESNLPVTEICRKVGYNDPKHFTHTFEKAAGVKPSTYRKLYG